MSFAIAASAPYGSGARHLLPAARTAPLEGEVVGNTRDVQAGTAYRASGFNEQTMNDWGPSRMSADAAILPEVDTIAGRSQDLIRNNGFAAGLKRRHADNILGPRGLRLLSTPNYKMLGKDEAWAQDFAEQAEGIYTEFGSDPEQCDLAGLLDLADMEEAIFFATYGEGDGFTLAHWRPDLGTKWNTKLQIIDGDRVKNPARAIDDMKIRGGIEINADTGAHDAIHVAKMPKSGYIASYFYEYFNYETERIPAKTAWGRRKWIHTVNRERAGQTRGISWLTPIIAPIRTGDLRVDLALKHSLVNSIVGMVIKADVDLASLFQGELSKLSAYQDIRRKDALAPMKSGVNVVRLSPGESIETHAAHLSTQVEQEIEAIMLQVFAGANLPRELVTMDFSKSSYVGIRAGLAEAARFFTSRREWFAQAFNRHVYRLVMEEAVNSGRIKAPGFYENIHAYCDCEWLGAARSYTDRLKEVNAAATAIDANLSTYAYELAEMGSDYRKVFRQRATEKKMMEQLGLDQAPSKTVLAYNSAPRDEGNGDRPAEKKPAEKQKEAA
jgi:lambda family phage portal protein